MALGLLETEEIVCSGANEVGSPVLYVGNTTGRDGVGGASFASSELTTNSLDNILSSSRRSIYRKKSYRSLS